MRKTKLTKNVTEKLVKAIKAGNFIDVAVVYAGISTASYYRWRERADKELTRITKALEHNSYAKILRSERKYVEFRDTIDEALSVAEVAAVFTIRSTFPDDWRSAAWYLERRYPDRWGRKIIGFKNDDGTKDFADAFNAAIRDVEDDEISRSGQVVPIK